MNQADMAELGINAQDWVDIVSIQSNGLRRTAKEFKLITYNILKRCAATYFPETNILVPLNSIAYRSHTPTSKFILVNLEKVNKGGHE